MEDTAKIGLVRPITTKCINIAFVANKGGVGKTRHCIVAGKYLASCGFKVCLVDFDDNNSTSYHFLTEETAQLVRSHNSCKLLQTEEADLNELTVPTNYPNISLIPASEYLDDLATVSERRLKRIIAKSKREFDFIIFDCKPAYNNITKNAINAADFIITPVLQDSDSYNAAAYLRDKIAMDTDKSENWFISVNGYNKLFANAVTGEQKDYVDSYKNLEGTQLTPEESWFPWTKDMNKMKDRGKRISEKKGVKNALFNPKLYDAVCNLVSCFVEDDLLPLPRPESF